MPLLLTLLLAALGLALAAAPCHAAATATEDHPPPQPPPQHRRALKRQSGFYNRVTDYAWRQTDMSVRQEQQSQLILQRIRSGRPTAGAEAAAIGTALLGSQNFEKRSARLHTQNNLDMNLRRYARPGQGGALGAVYRRIHPRVFETGDKDTDFRNNVWSNVMLQEQRRAQIAHEADLRRSRQVAYERGRGRAVSAPLARELTDVPKRGRQEVETKEEAKGPMAAAADGAGGSSNSTSSG
jgi:Spy/CpxP family protein refolding chaperone